MAKKARKRPTRAAAKRGTTRTATRRSTKSRSSSPAAGRSKSKRAGRKSPARATKARRAPATRAKSSKKASRPAARKQTARPAARTKTASKTPKPARSVKKAAARPARPVHPLSLERNRRHLPELEDNVPTPPSSLDMDRTPSAARSGRREMREARLQHNETSPELTGGDVDASWEDAYSVGDEAPGGDNPTPDQDRVDDIGKALGVQYDDSEELKAGDKISERDRHRWELDPASAEDYPEHEE